MDDTFRDLQERYIAELTAVMPAVLSWWTARAASPPDDVRPAPDGFEARWPAGPVAHPRILEIFRRHFLEADALNLAAEAGRPPEDPRPPGELWGEEAAFEPVVFVQPIDLLVNDLETRAPELHAIMRNLVFVPIGLDPAGEFC